MLKASHWSRNVHWDIVVVKSFGGKFATSSDGFEIFTYGGQHENEARVENRF